MKIRGFVVLLGIVSFMCGACGKQPDSQTLQSGPSTTADPAPATSSDAGPAIGGPAVASGSTESGIGSGASPSQTMAPLPNTLTAGDWDDNLNFTLYQAFVAQAQQADITLPQLQPAQTPRHTRQGAPSLDLAIVLDTTGSMGDELVYLQTEIASVIGQVSMLNPNLDLRLGLVVYRDVVDPYVTRTFDFTPSLQTFEGNLNAQQAAGGGDYPEAVEHGYAAAQQLTWREGNTVKIMFHIADAPAHAADYAEVVQRAASLAQQGVVIMPVSASGVDDALEYLMRDAAQVSGGRYVFLTNDSGVGNDHAAPTVPCYNVEKLNPLMVQLINDEIHGTSSAPDPNDILRTVGQVQGPTCTLDGNTTARLY